MVYIKAKKQDKFVLSTYIKKSFQYSTALYIVAGIFVGLTSPALAEQIENKQQDTEQAENLQDNISSDNALSDNTVSDNTVLGVVVVQGQGAITEGTNSYTADWMRTANGLALPQQQTPQSTSVITRQLMDDRGLQDIKSVMQNATGISVKQYDSERFTFQSRGFEVDNYQYDGVSKPLDSTYQLGDNTLDTVVYDHIEIVRGANGLMQGTGQPGASINFVRKRPTQQFEGYISGQVGTPKNYRTELDLGGPLNQAQTLRGRFVGALQTKDSTMDLYNVDKGVFYGAIEADLSDYTLLTINTGYQKTNPTGVTWSGLPAFDSHGSLINWPLGATTGANWTAWKTAVLESNASLEHTFENDWKVRLSATHLYNEFNAPLLSLSGHPDPVTGAGMSAGFVAKYIGARTQDSVAGSLNGDFDALGQNHEFVTGFSYSKTGGDNNAYFPTNAPTEIGNFFQWDGSYPEPQWAGTPASVTNYGSSEFGVYGATRLTIADPLHIILGGRFNWWNAHTYSSPVGSDYSYSGVFVPYAGITYDLIDNWTVYASYTDVYKPSLYQDIDRNYLDPAKGQNYEIGIKASLFDNRLNASFAVFQTEQDNLPQYVSYDQNTGISVYRAIKGTTTKGFEVEFAGQVYDGVNLFTGLTYRSSKDGNGDEYATDQPNTTFNLGATYDFTGVLDKLTIGGSMRWQSKTNSSFSYSDSLIDVVQDSYAVFDAMARYDFDDKTSLNFNIYNIANKKYYQTTGFFDTVYYGEGRTATLSLKRKF